jgi:hypothetical protein
MEDAVNAQGNITEIKQIDGATTMYEQWQVVCLSRCSRYVGLITVIN